LDFLLEILKITNIYLFLKINIARKNDEKLAFTYKILQKTSSLFLNKNDEKSALIYKFYTQN
jgi:hypothetical protein